MDSINFLLSIETRGIKLGFERTEAIMKACGNPHLGLPVIQVAGTNGKGSVCAILASILNAAGYKTGLFTSPHLMRVNERIRINGQPILDAEIDDFIQKTKILKDIDKNEIAIVKSYEDQKSKIKLLNKDSHKYEDTNDELFYEIGLIKNQLVLFMWTTLGWFKFEKFENKEDLLKYFTEETGLMFDPNLINIE